jgi:hypothetical protein
MRRPSASALLPLSHQLAEPFNCPIKIGIEKFECVAFKQLVDHALLDILLFLYGAQSLKDEVPGDNVWNPG